MKDIKFFTGNHFCNQDPDDDEWTKEDTDNIMDIMFPDGVDDDNDWGF